LLLFVLESGIGFHHEIPQDFCHIFSWSLGFCVPTITSLLSFDKSWYQTGKASSNLKVNLKQGPEKKMRCMMDLKITMLEASSTQTLQKRKRENG